MPRILQPKSREAGIRTFISAASGDMLPPDCGAGEGGRVPCQAPGLRLPVAPVPAGHSGSAVASRHPAGWERRPPSAPPGQVIPGDVRLSNYGKSLCVKGKIAEKFMYYLQFY